MTGRMMAAVLHAPGDLRIVEVARPADPGPGEVIVKVMAAGICGSDIARVMKTGTYRFPTIPGHEFAGIVEEVGSAVTGVRPGEAVAVAPLMPCFRCESCQHGHYSLCDCYDFLGSRSHGGFAQYVKAPARNLVPVPGGVGLDEAATVEPAGIILHGINKIEIGVGDAVAVIGIGALGYFATRFAKLSGARPIIAVDLDPRKLDLARTAGADITVDASQGDALEAIRAATGGRGVDVVLETAGSNAGREIALAAVRKQGTVLVYGSAHAEVVFKPELFERILRHEIALIGSWNSYSVPFPGREWRDIMKFVGSGELTARPLISHRLELDEAPGVFRSLLDRSFGPYGKILFAPHGTEALQQ
jgi:L-iditol 2-dehydrogenase